MNHSESPENPTPVTYTIVLTCHDCNQAWRFQMPEEKLRTSTFHRKTQCPTCHNNPDTAAYIKSTTTNTTCTASCKRAHDKECHCSCGGLNHGITAGFQKSPITTA